ncbi:MAG: hypothetical protein QOJ19_4233, partial [Acidimicrobiia bacterium]|nr:hypothetical protein [Acidimicrobiia bacterium]
MPTLQRMWLTWNAAAVVAACLA